MVFKGSTSNEFSSQMNHSQKSYRSRLCHTQVLHSLLNMVQPVWVKDNPSEYGAAKRSLSYLDRLPQSQRGCASLKLVEIYTQNLDFWEWFIWHENPFSMHIFPYLQLLQAMFSFYSCCCVGWHAALYIFRYDGDLLLSIMLFWLGTSISSPILNEKTISNGKTRLQKVVIVCFFFYHHTPLPPLSPSILGN